MSLFYSVLIRSVENYPEQLDGIPLPLSTPALDVDYQRKGGKAEFETGAFTYDRVIYLHVDKNERDTALQEIGTYVSQLLRDHRCYVALCFGMDQLVLRKDEMGLNADTSFGVVKDTPLLESTGFTRGSGGGGSFK